MTSAVLDTTAFIPIVHDGPLSPVARQLAETCSFVAPSNMFAEAVNVLRRFVRSGEMTQPNAEAALRVLNALVEERPIAGLAADAFELTRILDHSAYDCFFAGLARAETLPLITADRTFADKVVARLPDVEVIDLFKETETLP